MVLELAAISGFVAASVRVATPLALAAVGEAVAERGGVINLGIEGAMLAGALAAAIGASSAGVGGGLSLALLAGVAVSAVFGALVIRGRTDQIITGTAVTLGISGLTGLVARQVFGTAGAGLALPTLPKIEIPGLAAIPMIGPAFFNQSATTYLAYLLTIAAAWLLFSTRFGLELRACGEAPHAAAAAGVPVARRRFTGILIGGACAGLAGATLVLAQVGTFTEKMTAGRGFIAVAIVVLGRWHPLRVGAAALLFGSAIAMQFLFQATGSSVPYQFFLVLPYLLAIAALAIAVGRRGGPAALGSAATLALLIMVTGCEFSRRELAPIRIEPVITLGMTSGSGAMVSVPRVSPSDSRGYRVLLVGAAGLPMLYSEGGRYLGTLGKIGDGPDGFRNPQFTRIGPADSLWVFDAADRVLVFGPDRGYGRSVALPLAPWDAALLPRGRMLLGSSSQDRPLPVLLVDSTGAVLREIGGRDSVSMAIHSPRWLITAPDGSFWTIPMIHRWRLEHWDTAGNLVQAIERSPDWFQPYAQFSGGNSTEPPSPMLMGGWFDASGRLWLLGQAADPHWVSGLTTSRNLTQGPSISDPDRVFDTMLEVIDPGNGKLVAETRFDMSYPSVVEPGLLMRSRQTNEGWKRAELVRVILDTTQLAHLQGGRR